MTLSDPSTLEAMNELMLGSKAALQQALDLLNEHLTDELLTVHSKFLPGSTIGKHLRHSRDHFELLLDAIAAPPPYVFSYDTRSRNTPMETSCMEAKKALLSTKRRLDLILGADMNAPMTLQAVTPNLHTFQTTVGRELWFASLHCVHHWSMVRVIAGEHGITLEPDFGFAPSTLVYQERDTAMAKI